MHAPTSQRIETNSDDYWMGVNPKGWLPRPWDQGTKKPREAMIAVGV